MKIIAISDTHGHHREYEIPNGDILFHCGDFVQEIGYGTQDWSISTVNEELLDDFILWFHQQPHDLKILSVGNHDRVTRHSIMEAVSRVVPKEEAFKVILSVPTAEVVYRGVRIVSMPFVPMERASMWAFSYERNRDKDFWDGIDLDGTDIFISHGPCHKVLDKDFRNHHHYGSTSLYKLLDKYPRIRLHVHGHIHEEYGQSSFHPWRHTVNCALEPIYHHKNKMPVVIHYDENMKRVTFIQTNSSQGMQSTNFK